jgi:outer membrane receptor for ferrienterochelin and colicins
MKNILIIIFILLNVSFGFSQTIEGNVFERESGQKIFLPGVNIMWVNSLSGTVSDPNGHFHIGVIRNLPDTLIVSYVGFKTDTVIVKQTRKIEIELKKSLDLKEVEISARQNTLHISTAAPINTETITEKELQKAACCNLAESFETNASVDVNYTDAVSGARQIRMLGLDGIYTGIFTENTPAIRGLASSYGLGYYPGTWVESIQISKGPGSVVNGYESISGQINIEFFKPETADKFFFNAYVSDMGRFEGNVHYTEKISKELSTMGFFHGSTVTQRIDRDKNGFLDTPLLNQLNFFNRWKYNKEGKFMAQAGIRVISEDKQGGQVGFNPSLDYGTINNYGIGINTKQVQGFTKTALGFEGKPYKSLGLINNFIHHDQRTYFGLTNYNGQQNTFSSNLIYQSIIGHTLHKFKTGASFLSDNYVERLNDSLFSRHEIVPGAFAEYHYDYPENISVLAGIRMDYHNLYGILVNPRIHVKKNISQLTVIRLSAGRGLRVPNLIAENIGILASSRQIIVTEQINPEVAWNYGASFVHKFNLFKRDAVFTTDFYRTDFVNQAVVDFDADATKIYFYNLDGRSYSNSFQAELAFEPIKCIQLRTAYRWNDVKSTYMGELLQRPLVNRDRVLLNIAYASKFDKWKFDVTFNWFGNSRMPLEATNPYHAALPPYSPDYLIVNTQVTRAFKKYSIYLGAENLTNYMQHNPIIAAHDPFGPNFDASMIWGPLMGRVVYAGIRYNIK